MIPLKVELDMLGDMWLYIAVLEMSRCNRCTTFSMTDSRLSFN